MINISSYITEKLHLNKEIKNVPIVTNDEFTIKVGDFIKFYYGFKKDCNFVDEYDPMRLRRQSHFPEQFLSNNNATSDDLINYFKENEDAEIKVKQRQSAGGVTFYRIYNLPNVEYGTSTINDLKDEQIKDLQGELIKYFTK